MYMANMSFASLHLSALEELLRKNEGRLRGKLMQINSAITPECKDEDLASFKEIASDIEETRKHLKVGADLGYASPHRLIRIVEFFYERRWSRLEYRSC